MKDYSVQLSPWTDLPAPLGKSREMKFIKPLNLTGISSSRGTKVQRFKMCGEYGFVICSSTRMEDVPAASTFSVEDMVSVSRAAMPPQYQYL